MKLRLHEDTVRVRLKQVEVARLASGSTVAAVTRFDQGQFEVELRAAGATVHAAFGDGRLVISVPMEQIVAWAESQDEGIYGTNGTVIVAIEKDYACLHKAGVENADTYPNPAAAGTMER